MYFGVMIVAVTLTLFASVVTGLPTTLDTTNGSSTVVVTATNDVSSKEKWYEKRWRIWHRTIVDSSDEIYDLWSSVIICLVSISVLIQIIIVYLYSRQNLFPVSITGSGLIFSFGTDTFLINKSGELHNIWCLNQMPHTPLREPCDCKHERWIQNFIKAIRSEASKMGIDVITNLRDVIIRGKLIVYGGIFYMSIDTVECSEPTVFAEPGNYACIILLTLSTLILLVNMYFRKWVPLMVSTATLGMAMISQSTASEKTNISIALLLGSGISVLVVSTISFVYELFHVIRLKRQESNTRYDYKRFIKRGQSKLKEVSEFKTFTYTETNVLKVDMPSGKASVHLILYKIIFFLILLGSVNASSTITCSGDTGTRGFHGLVNTYNHEKWTLGHKELLQDLENLNSQLSQLHNYTVPVCTNYGKQIHCDKAYSKVSVTGALQICILGRIGCSDASNFKYKTNIPLSTRGVTLSELYLSDRSLNLTQTGNDTGDGYCAVTTCLYKYDFLLLSEYPRLYESLELDLSPSDINKTRHKRLIGVWSYYSHTAKYCSTCVALSDFNKWKSKIEASITQLITSVQDLQTAVGDTNHALHKLMKDLTSLATEFKNFAISTDRRLNAIDADLYTLEMYLAIKAKLSTATAHYNSAHMTIQNLLLDAATLGRPSTSIDLFTSYAGRRVLPDGRNLTDVEHMWFLAIIDNRLNIVLAYKTALTMSVSFPSIVSDHSTCVFWAEGHIYHLENIALVYTLPIPGSKVRAIRRPKIDTSHTKATHSTGWQNSAEIRSDELLFDAEIFKIDTNKSHISINVSDTNDLKQHFKKSTYLYVPSRTGFTLFCALPCSVIAQGDYHSLGRPGKDYKQYFSFSIRQKYFIETIHDFFFIEKPTDGRIGLTSNVEALPAYHISQEEFNPSPVFDIPDFSNVTKLIDKSFQNLNLSSHALELASQLKDEAERLNFTTEANQPDFIQAIGHIAGDVLHDVLGIPGALGALAKNILSGGIFSFLHYILIGALLLFVLVYPFVVYKFMENRGSQPQTIEEVMPSAPPLQQTLTTTGEHAEMLALDAVKRGEIV